MSSTPTDAGGGGEPTAAQLLAFGYAPGGYIGNCRDCRTQQFDLDKRASRCKACATFAWQKASVLASAQKDAALASQPTASRGDGDKTACHWGGGNDIIWCSTCGAEYAYAKGEPRPDCPLASAPPAPVSGVGDAGAGAAERAGSPVAAPDVGSDLAKLSAAATPGEWYHVLPFQTVPAERTIHGRVPAERVDYISTWPGKGTPPGHCVIVPTEGRESRMRSHDMAFVAAIVTAYRSGRLVEASASPPPGEDLAGQGEPVAIKVRKALLMAREAVLQKVESYRPWAEKIAGRVNPWQPVLDALDEAIAETAAPAPSRPADRGLTQDDLVLLMAREWLNANDSDGNMIESVGEFAMWSPEDCAACQKVAAAILERLALRDAPRDAGNGWNPMETAPRDGTLFWALQTDRDPDEQQFVCWWQEDFSNWTGWRDNWDTEPEPTHWRPLPAPPSPPSQSPQTSGGDR